MKPGQAIDRLRALGFDASTDGADLILMPAEPDAALTPERRQWLVDHKAAIIEALRSLPVFTVEDERALVDYYCNRPRAERLTMHRRGVELHREGWPWREADLQAMREQRDGMALRVLPEPPK